MTDQELAHLRLALRVELLKRVVASLYSAHCSRYPEQAPGLIHEMNRLREQFSQLALKATSPDSEVIASELREALDDVVGPIDNALGPFSFPAPQPP